MRAAMAVCVIFLMSNASCELFDKVDDITFNVVLEHPFIVDEDFDSNGEERAYSDLQIVNAADVNQEFNKYKDKFKSITVNKITYVVSDYVADGTVLFNDGKLGFSAQGATAKQLAELAFVNIQTAVGTEWTLPINQAGLDEVAHILKDDKIVVMHSVGKFSSTPVAFKVLVKLDCTVTADAL
jgi:hypothetical protein